MDELNTSGDREESQLVSQALSAFQLGFLSQKLNFGQQSLGRQNRLDAEDVVLCLNGIDRALNGMTPQSNDYQRSTYLELRKRIIALHDTTVECLNDDLSKAIADARNDIRKALGGLNQLIEKDTIVAPMTKHQNNNWIALRDLLLARVGQDNRLASWFEIGDQLADTICSLRWAGLPGKLPEIKRCKMYTGVDKVPDREEVPSIGV